MCFEPPAKVEAASDDDDADYGSEKPDFSKVKLATKQAAFYSAGRVYYSSQNGRVSEEADP